MLPKHLWNVTYPEIMHMYKSNGAILSTAHTHLSILKAISGENGCACNGILTLNKNMDPCHPKKSLTFWKWARELVKSAHPAIYWEQMAQNREITNSGPFGCIVKYYFNYPAGR